MRAVLASATVVLLGLSQAGCTSWFGDESRPPPLLLEKGHDQALFDAEGHLVRLIQDADGDRRAEAVTFYRPDGVALRKEIDTDNDGAIDRWENYDSRGRLVRVGLATHARPRPRPDTWVFLDEHGGERRREWDDDGDGLPDRAEEYDLGRVVAEEQATHGGGHFDRRVIRGLDGEIVRIETEGDAFFPRALR
jgi:hypothetical protein